METEVEQKKELKVTPKLRFSEFKKSWFHIKLGELLTFKNGLNSDKEKYGRGIKFINVLDIINNDYITYERIIGTVEVTEKELEKNAVTYGDILFQRSSETRKEVGQSNVYLDEIPVVFGGFVIRGHRIKDYNALFLHYLLKTGAARKEITSKSGGSTRYNVGQETLSNVVITTTSIPEQQKIASFLSDVDKKIQQLIRKKELLESYKKGVMQKLFSQEIRFKNKNGKEFPEWEKKKFHQVFERVTRKNKNDNKNVLTISAQHGLVNRLEHYINSVAAKDLSNYYLLHRNEFAYNKSYSKGYPMGAIKRLTKYDEGVVSTLYICFKAKPSHSIDFFEHYFENGKFNKQLARIAQEGARNHGLLNLSVVEFFKDLVVFVPTLEEQQQIADFLSAIDKKIDAVSQQIEKTQTFKKGLLQQMFV